MPNHRRGGRSYLDRFHCNRRTHGLSGVPANPTRDVRTPGHRDRLLPQVPRRLAGPGRTRQDPGALGGGSAGAASPHAATATAAGTGPRRTAAAGLPARPRRPRPLLRARAEALSEEEHLARAVRLRSTNTIAKPIVDDDLWPLIQPLLLPPKARRARYPGRKPLDDRAVLTGILFVQQPGIPWEMLHKEMGCRSGMSCRSSARYPQACSLRMRAMKSMDKSALSTDS
ncbi:hypothetical protein CBM2587_B80086 [Cupriavidus taiwanensis]|uniref:Insertion element IS402-like domain-containing protein n=1 Tax=Cupriavidus taiwanensis TaxID=164546 RepID=A0A975XD87_9BURK|nr:hypothetical protein CBM2587_B80086 [Cupriavidus taiwanensis]